MPSMTPELEKQVEAAYDYRGHVTIRFKTGDAAEGFVFNRQFASPQLKEDPFIEVFLKGSGERKKYSLASIESIALTGEDCAAGKSYEDYLKKQSGK